MPRSIWRARVAREPLGFRWLEAPSELEVDALVVACVDRLAEIVRQGTLLDLVTSTLWGVARLSAP